MSSFPGSPRLIKGALVGVDLINPLASVVVFRYNPDTMMRRLDARWVGGGETGDRSEAFRLTGPPKETISLNIEVDATDQQGRGSSGSLIYEDCSAQRIRLGGWVPKRNAMTNRANGARGFRFVAVVPTSTSLVCEHTWRGEWSRDFARQRRLGGGMKQKSRSQIVSRVGWWCEERQWRARVRYQTPGCLRLHRAEPWQLGQDPQARLLPYWGFSSATSRWSKERNNSSAVRTSSSSATGWNVKPLTRRKISDAASRFSASARWSNVRKRCSTDCVMHKVYSFSGHFARLAERSDGAWQGLRINV